MVTLGVFPQDALKEQNTWTQRFPKKPADMGIKEYVARVVKINNYLPQFLPTVPLGNSEKLANNEPLELLV